MKKYLKYVVLAILLFMIVAQFFPIDKTNPPLDLSKDFISITQPTEKIAGQLKTACYDCHSHEARYPWYADVAPISWWLQGHINNGRKHLNFSVWGDYSDEKKDHKLDECVDFVDKNWMPLLSYKVAHPESKLSDEDRAAMIAFFQKLKSK